MSGTYYFTGLAASVLCALLGWYLGKHWKNRPVIGAVLGFVLPVLGLLVLLIIVPKKKARVPA